MRIAEAVEAGVDGIIFPHVLTPEEAALGVELLGGAAWPSDPGGRLVGVHMIEDPRSVENARAILATPGVRIVFRGPMSLTTAYQGDTVAVEEAFRSVLAVCARSWPFRVGLRLARAARPPPRRHGRPARLYRIAPAHRPPRPMVDLTHYPPATPTPAPRLRPHHPPP